MKKIRYQVKIIPNKLICNKNFYLIELKDKKYIITEFWIYLENNKIEKIIIKKGLHPNCDPKSKELCIDYNLKRQDFNNNILDLIIQSLHVFNFNSAFYQPWNAFEYKGEP